MYEKASHNKELGESSEQTRLVGVAKVYPVRWSVVLTEDGVTSRDLDMASIRGSSIILRTLVVI